MKEKIDIKGGFDVIDFFSGAILWIRFAMTDKSTIRGCFRVSVKSVLPVNQDKHKGSFSDSFLVLVGDVSGICGVLGSSQNVGCLEVNRQDLLSIRNQQQIPCGVVWQGSETSDRPYEISGGINFIDTALEFKN